MTDQRLYTANAPVVRVDGAPPGEVARDLLRLDVSEDTAGLRTMVLRLAAVTPSADAVAGDPAYLDGSVLDFGSSVTVDFGPPDRAGQIFDGVVSAIELCLTDGDLPHVAVYAEDALMGLRMTRRSRTYEDVTDADVAARIAADHGLRADTAADGPVYPVLQQLNQSDLAFLRDRAAHVEAEVWVEGGTLHFATRPHRQAGAVTLVYGNELLSAHVRADLAHQRSSVTMCGFDLDAKDTIEERADDSVIRAETTGGRTGPGVLADALGEFPAVRVRAVPTTADQARAWAEAAMRRRGRGFVVAAGTTAGTPELTVGTLLRLDRVGTPFSGPGYYTTWVRHSFDPATGSRTRFRAERATVTS